MYEKNSKALNDKDLEKAAGGGFYLTRGTFRNAYYYDEKGNKQGENWFTKDARANAEKYGNFATEIDSEKQMEALRNNGYVQIGNKVYYKDGSSRVVR